MNTKMAALVILALGALVYAILWYVAGGFVALEIALVAILVALSIAYLFYEALTCRIVRKRIIGLGLFRRLDLKEVSRIFGAIAILPLASIVLAKYALNSSITPLRLYVLFVLLFLVGWALGTVETSKLLEEREE